MLPEVVSPIPGPKSRALADKLARYEVREVTMLSEDFPIFWDRAEGSNVWDVDGNRFLDFTAAFAVASLGHSAVAVREPLVEQSAMLLHAMGDVHPAGIKADLCEALSRTTFERWGSGPGKSFLANSGSEAVEAALKTAFVYSGKRGVIHFSGAYHGLGYGALEVGGLPYFRELFRPQLARFGVQIPFPGGSSPGLEEIGLLIRAAIRENEIGCMIVEPVQGRGGEVVPPREFLSLLRKICNDEKILLVLDEIYTGFNRTGRLFACEHSEVVPDIICLGKALTGGFPLAACIGRAEVMDAWPVSQGEALHTSTMLGNPLGCAMALASIAEHLKPETQRLAQEAGERLRAGLLSLRSPFIAEVRGLGAMLGVELVQPDGSPFGALAGRIMAQGLREGLILLGGGPKGNVLSFSPPFTITDEEVAFLIDRLAHFFDTLPSSLA